MSSEWPSPFQQVAPPPPPPPAEPAGRSTSDWLLAVGVVAAAIALVAVLGLIVWTSLNPSPTASLGPSPTQVAVATTPPAPTATATPSPDATATATSPASPGTSPTPSTSGPAPLATVPVDIAAQIDQVVAQMPAIRELAELRPVTYYLITRERFIADLQELFDEETDPQLLGAQERALKRLGLLPADADLGQMVIDLNSGAVAAFYRPDTAAFYIIERTEPFGPLDRVFVAHEYTHALQDQHFDLETNRITDPAEGDATLAQLAVIEGDASNAMLQWATQHLSFEEYLEMLRSSLSQTDPQQMASMPPILRREIAFPYADGLEFAMSLYDDGGMAAIDAAIQQPPESTEQILHPEKYAADERPADVLVNDASAALGSDWSQALVQTVGELDMQVFVAGGEAPPETIPGLPAGDWPHSEVAAGWNGDRLAMWETTDHQGWALAWVTAWDTPADADEFATRLDELLPTLSGSTRIMRGGADVVTLLLASDPALLDVVDDNIGR